MLAVGRQSTFSIFTVKSNTIKIRQLTWDSVSVWEDENSVLTTEVNLVLIYMKGMPLELILKKV